MVNMADVQILLQKWLVCLLGRPAAAERPAFGSRRLPGNSQMLEHGIGLSPPTLGALGSKEVLRASSTSIMCWSISGAIGPPLSSPPGSSVSQGCSVSPTRERRQSIVLGGGGLITSAKAARHEVGLPKVRHSGAVRETPCSQCPGKRSLGTWAIPGNRQRNIITMGATARVAFVVTWTEESVPGCGGCRPWGVPCQTCNHHRTFLVSSTNREEAVKIQCPWKGSIKDD